MRELTNMRRNKSLYCVAYVFFLFPSSLSLPTKQKSSGENGFPFSIPNNNIYIFFKAQYFLFSGRMCEPEEDKACPFPPKQQPQGIMDSVGDDDDDVNLQNSWPLDQLTFLSNPPSPFIISSSEQPFSPLWTFSDEENKLGSAAGYSLFLTC